jgi:hypothetical protein
MEFLVLNQGSLPFHSDQKYFKEVESFYKILHNLKPYGTKLISPKLNGLSYFNSSSLNFNTWLNNLSDRDLQRLVKGVLTSIPCEQYDELEINEFIFEHKFQKALEFKDVGFAAIKNHKVISFNSCDFWSQSSINIEKKYLVDNCDDYKTDSHVVHNISTNEHLQQIIININLNQKNCKKYFDELKNIPEKFPNLLYTDSFFKDIKSIDENYFREIKQVLNKLNDAISKSKNINELKINSNLDISGESISTMQNRSKTSERTFKHPTLGLKIFETHVKNFSHGKRMHILVDYESKNICIGYFGKHLSTSTIK